MKYIIFDIGGTFVKWAVLSENYDLIENNKFAVDALEKNCQVEMVPKIVNTIEELANKYPDLKGIGISTAGDVDPHSFEIIGSVPNHKNYAGTNYKQILKKYLDLGWSLIVMNDANAAVMGEYVKGQLQGVSDAIMITLGTDIGAGIILNNQLFSGCNGCAGEVGYLNVLDRRYGTYFSAIGLKRLAKEFNLIEPNQHIEPAEILKNSDHKFDQLIEYWYQGLAIGLANLIALFNPKKIIIGGGLSDSKMLDLNRIETIINKNLIEKHLIKMYQLELALHGNHAALYGCLYFLKQVQNNEGK